MNLVSYEFGQVLQLIRLEEMRPPSGVYVPDLHRAIRERYRFVTGPDPNLTPPTEGSKFEVGILPLGGRMINIKSLGIYVDGLVIACWNTDDADAITDELIAWMIETFRLRPPQTHIPRRHSSSVVVDFDVSMDEFLLDFSKIASAFQAFRETDQGVAAEVHLNRIAIGPDLVVGANASQTTFVLEQKAATTASDRRYFSGAPLTSAAHLALLQEIESIAGRRIDNQLR